MFRDEPIRVNFCELNLVAFACISALRALAEVSPKGFSESPYRIQHECGVTRLSYPVPQRQLIPRSFAEIAQQAHSEGSPRRHFSQPAKSAQLFEDLWLLIGRPLGCQGLSKAGKHLGLAQIIACEYANIPQASMDEVTAEANKALAAAARHFDPAKREFTAYADWVTRNKQTPRWNSYSCNISGTKNEKRSSKPLSL